MITHDSIQPLLEWIKLHPTWAGFVVFLISLSESLAIVGLVVPGVFMMTAIGAMMGSGILPFYETLTWAILGAIAGDGLSYWLGYHYHQQLKLYWPFKQFPGLLARGETFFRNHGGKSIIIGRFVGPVRPMIPVIAGMMDMTPKRFLFFNILSAIVWAPLYSLPGIVIGVSLGSLSPEVAKRISVLILLLLLALWCIYEVLLLLGSWFKRMTNTWIHKLWIFTSTRSEWISKFCETKQGSREGQFTLLLLIITSFVLFLIITVNVEQWRGVAALNEPVYHILRALYVPKLTHTMILISNLASPLVLLPVAACLGFYLYWKSHIRIAFSWLILNTITILLSFIIKALIQIPRPEGLTYLPELYAYPSNHTLLIIVFLGLIGGYVRKSLRPSFRFVTTFILIMTTITIACARLYLGTHWFTDILGSVTLGTTILCLGLLFFRKIEPGTLSVKLILVPTLVFWGTSYLTYDIISYNRMKAEFVRQWSVEHFEPQDWWKNVNMQILHRTGALKRQATLFDVEWLDPLQKVHANLTASGWEKLPELTVKNAAQLLSDNPNPAEFPVLPKFHRDRLPVLTLGKVISPHERLVLQIWQSDYSTDKDVPLWVGTLRSEQVTHPLPLVSLFMEQVPNKHLIKVLLKSLDLSSIKTKTVITRSEEPSEDHYTLLIKPK